MKHYTERGLTAGKWYCCMHVNFDFNDNEYTQDGAFFKYLGDGQAELDSNAANEPNTFGIVPFADYYIDC